MFDILPGLQAWGGVKSEPESAITEALLGWLLSPGPHTTATEGAHSKFLHLCFRPWCLYLCPHLGGQKEGLGC